MSSDTAAGSSCPSLLAWCTGLCQRSVALKVHEPDLAWVAVCTISTWPRESFLWHVCMHVRKSRDGSVVTVERKGNYEMRWEGKREGKGGGGILVVPNPFLPKP